MIFNQQILKKLISILAVTCFLMQNLSLPAYCAQKHKTYPRKTTRKVQQVRPKKKPAPKKEEKKEDTFKIPLIEDDLANSLDASKYKKINYKYVPLEDYKPQTKQKKFRKKEYVKDILPDEEVVLSDENKNFKKPVYTGIIPTELGQKVLLKPLKKIHTKNSKIKVKRDKKTEKYKVAYPHLGEKIVFKVLKDVEKDGNIIIPKGTNVSAQVGEVSPRAMGGAPAEMTLENFQYIDENGKTINLSGNVSSCGYSLSVWIGLAELATTPFLFGLAVPALRVLPGGQAVVTPRKTYTVYY